MPKFLEHNALDPFPLDAGSVNLVITSPPYFNLRDYKGDPRQIGLEVTPQEYVDKMVQVGRNVRQVLAKDGSYFLNIGDTYNSKNKCLMLVPHRVAIGMIDDGWILRNTIIWHKPNHMPCSIKDRLTPSHEYVFHFVQSKKYYYDLDAIRVPHQTLKADRHVDNEKLAAKIGKDITVMRQGSLLELEEVKKKGYDSTKLEGESIKNIGARWGFNRDGETMENRYSDGGKNPGDVFQEERKFTREDELRAEKEFGFTRHAAARVTARLRMGLAKNHPLGKNPGDVQNPHTEQGAIIERGSGSAWFLEGFQTECPDCGSQFETSPEELWIENPSDVWSICTVPFPDAHYAVFPPKLVQTMIKAGSRVGDTVLDPFSGSGTTAITADSLNRTGVGFDLSYNDVRERRVAKGIQKDLVIDAEAG
jgi:DNA modification methylase